MPAALISLLRLILPFFGGTALRAGAGLASKIPGLSRVPGATRAVGALSKPGAVSEALGFGGAFFGLDALFGGEGEGADVSEGAEFQRLLEQKKPLRSDDVNFLRLLQQEQVAGNLGPTLENAGINPQEVF